MRSTIVVLLILLYFSQTVSASEKTASHPSSMPTPETNEEKKMFDHKKSEKKDARSKNVGAPYKKPASLKKGEILHLETGNILNKQEFFNYISYYPLIYVGETHDSIQDHNVQLEIIQSLNEKFPGEIALGLEMLQTPYQASADAFIKGTMGDKEFYKIWSKNWHVLYRYYKGIIQYAKENKITLVALNVDQKLKDSIKEKGFDNLSPELKKKLPEMDLTDPHQNAFIEALFESHTHGSKYADIFLKSQVLWEETMAESAASYLKSERGKGKHLVVLSGGVHINYGFGIPRKLFRRLPLPYLIIEPHAVSVSKAKQANAMKVRAVTIPLKPVDFYWAVKYEGIEDETILLGVEITNVKEGVKIGMVAPGSPAEKAGIKEKDIVIAMDGVEIKEVFDLTYQLTLHKAKDTGTVEVLRKNEKKILQITYDVLKPHK